MKTNEALRDFITRRPGELSEIRQIIEVSDDSLYDWLRGKRIPTGTNLIALRLFLEIAGYELDELKAMDPGVYRLGQAIVFAGHDPQALANSCGMTGRGGRGDMILGYVTQGNKISQERLTSLLKLIEGSDSVIDLKSTKLRLSLKRSTHNALDVAKKLIEAYRMATQFVTASFGPEDRKSLRQFLNDEGVSIHEIDTLVTMLTSERAYTNITTLKERHKQ